MAARFSQTTSSSDGAQACPDSDVVKQLNAYITAITSGGATTPADALDFWTQNKYQYNTIGPIAQDLLAAPACLSSLCREDFLCVWLISGRRNRMNKSLEMRTCLNQILVCLKKPDLCINFSYVC